MEWGDLWRKVKKVVVHSEFISEELSWKGRLKRIKYLQIFSKYYSGGDLALLELYPETYSEIEGKVIPACLPDPEDDEDLDNTERGKYPDSHCCMTRKGVTCDLSTFFTTKDGQPYWW